MIKIEHREWTERIWKITYSPMTDEIRIKIDENNPNLDKVINFATEVKNEYTGSSTIRGTRRPQTDHVVFQYRNKDVAFIKDFTE
jgi:hypothetical protein